MAKFVNSEAESQGLHGIWESSNLKATDVGNLYDCLVRDAEGNEIAVDNGVALAVGDYTGNGLQERYATIAATTDAIAVVGAVATIKDANTKSEKAATNFYVKAGELAKTYEVVKDDIFGIAQYQFTDASVANVAQGAYVVVDGEGAWIAQTSEPSKTAYGFIGKVHSIAASSTSDVTTVRVVCVKNEAIA